MEEIWLPIRDFPDYQVSNHGRVKSLKKGQERILKIHINRVCGEYRSICLCRRGRPHRRYIHRLVAEAFIGAAEEGSEVDHLDHDPGNNRLDNLQWVTRQENIRRNAAILMRGETHYACKLRDIDIVAIRELAAGGKITQYTIAKCFGIRQASVSNIFRNKRWSHITDSASAV